MDPSDKRVLTFDWSSEALPATVTIASQTFTIGVIRQSGVTALTKDQESILAGSRSTQLRLDATTATVGDKYTVSNKIVTSEIPPQTIERQFTVLVQNR